MAAPHATSSAERIGDLLVREGVITAEQLQKGASGAEAERYSRRLQPREARIRSRKSSSRRCWPNSTRCRPSISFSRFELDPKIAKMIPADLAQKNLVIPLKREGRTLTVAMADPSNLGAVLEDLKFITRYDIFPVIAGEYTLRNLIDKMFGASLRPIRWRR